MALAARHRGMEASQREARCGVVEGPISPVRRAVALVASLREAGRHVIRVGGALIIFQVALRARAAGQAVIVVYVTLRASERGVEPGKCKSRRGVIERCRRPVRGAVARLASLRESGGRMR